MLKMLCFLQAQLRFPELYIKSLYGADRVLTLIRAYPFPDFREISLARKYVVLVVRRSWQSSMDQLLPWPSLMDCGILVCMAQIWTSSRVRNHEEFMDDHGGGTQKSMTSSTNSTPIISTKGHAKIQSEKVTPTGTPKEKQLQPNTSSVVMMSCHHPSPSIRDNPAQFNNAIFQPMNPLPFLRIPMILIIVFV